MCQIYNLQPDELLWKWEALNFKPSATRSEISPFTMDSISALKAQIQRDMDKGSANKTQTRTNANGAAAVSVGRNLPAFMRRNVNAMAGMKPGTAQVKMEEDGSVHLAGPSKVRFVGPMMDASSRTKRACSYPTCC